MESLANIVFRPVDSQIESNDMGDEDNDKNNTDRNNNSISNKNEQRQEDEVFVIMPPTGSESLGDEQSQQPQRQPRGQRPPFSISKMTQMARVSEVKEARLFV